MKTFLVKTQSLMENTYKVEAANEEEAKKIALENTQDILSQSQLDEGEILSINEVGE